MLPIWTSLKILSFGKELFRLNCHTVSLFKILVTVYEQPKIVMYKT